MTLESGDHSSECVETFWNCVHIGGIDAIYNLQEMPEIKTYRPF